MKEIAELLESLKQYRENLAEIRELLVEMLEEKCKK